MQKSNTKSNNNSNTKSNSNINNNSNSNIKSHSKLLLTPNTTKNWGNNYNYLLSNNILFDILIFY
jgi:hypothetical protein